jgi:release factor glutamine methyltransferase
MVETVGSLIALSASALSEAGYEDPRRHARRLLASALSATQSDLFAHPDRLVEEHQVSRLRLILKRMLDREPLSRIIQLREFWGLQLALSAETLDPRPETETVVEAVLRRIPDRQRLLRILDLGTGTGCLLLALLSEFPASVGVGTDISEDAVRTAAGNASSLGLADRALFFVGDWGRALATSFDVIVANPPYIASADLRLLPWEVARYDPPRALDGGEDGVGAYRSIAADLGRLLASDGIFVAEVGAGQDESVADIVKANGLAVGGIEKDLCGIARCVVARPTIVGKKWLEYSPVPSRVP